MDDVRILPGPGCPAGLVIPDAELTERFSHSSGPGGQGVNTSDSRVQLSVDLATLSTLSDAQRARALAALAPRLSGTVLSIDSSEQRSQRQNRVAARARMAQLLREALAPPVHRKASKPTRGSKLRRLEGKRQRSETKQQRRRPNF